MNTYTETEHPAPGVYVTKLHVEWTPTAAPVTAPLHIGSSWRDARGKPLSNAAILRYAAEGRYGEEMQRRATEKGPSRDSHLRRSWTSRLNYIPAA